VGQEEVQEVRDRVNNADAPGLEGESQSGGSVFFELLSGLGWFSPDLSLLIVARTGWTGSTLNFLKLLKEEYKPAR
jgi:hypothetical protein